MGQRGDVLPFLTQASELGRWPELYTVLPFRSGLCYELQWTNFAWPLERLSMTSGLAIECRTAEGL